MVFVSKEGTVINPCLVTAASVPLPGSVLVIRLAFLPTEELAESRLAVAWRVMGT